MATKQELNEAAKAVISETQESKRAETQAYWDETGTACDILDHWRSSQPIRVEVVRGPDPEPYPEIVRMNSKQYVMRSHALSMIEGAILGASFVTLTMVLIALGGIFA